MCSAFTTQWICHKRCARAHCGLRVATISHWYYIKLPNGGEEKEFKLQRSSKEVSNGYKLRRLRCCQNVHSHTSTHAHTHCAKCGKISLALSARRSNDRELAAKGQYSEMKRKRKRAWLSIFFCSILPQEQSQRQLQQQQRCSVHIKRSQHSPAVKANGSIYIARQELKREKWASPWWTFLRAAQRIFVVHFGRANYNYHLLLAIALQLAKTQ